MRFLVDESTGIDVAHRLRRYGHRLALVFGSYLSLCAWSAEPLIVDYHEVRDDKYSKPTLEFFSPKVPLESLKFAFQPENRLYCELSGNHEMLFEEYMRAGMWKDHMPMETPMAHDSEQWVLQRIPEALGDYYTVFDLARHTFFSSAIAGIVPYPTGDGGGRGFLARLGEAPGNHEELLAVQGNFASRARFAPMPEISLTDSDRAAMTSLLSAQTDEEFTIGELKTIYYQYSELAGVVATVSLHSSKIRWLYCFAKLRDGWRICPIEDFGYTDKAPGGGMTFENPELENDWNLSNSHLHILQDVDGNGSTEFLITSDSISWLFALTETYTESGRVRLSFRPIKQLYFGP